MASTKLAMKATGVLFDRCEDGELRPSVECVVGAVALENWRLKSQSRHT